SRSTTQAGSAAKANARSVRFLRAQTVALKSEWAVSMKGPADEAILAQRDTTSRWATSARVPGKSDAGPGCRESRDEGYRRLGLRRRTATFERCQGGTAQGWRGPDQGWPVRRDQGVSRRHQHYLRAGPERRSRMGQQNRSRDHAAY